MGVARALGAEVFSAGGEEDVVVVRGGRHARETSIDCGESGTCLRISGPIAALFPERITVTGTGSLLGRPVDMMEKPLRELGAECSTTLGKPPVTVRGPLRGGRTVVDGSQTSQVVSGLLMALPLCRGDSEIEVRNLVSRDYLALTVSVLAGFGIAIEEAGPRPDGRVVFFVRGDQAYRPRPFTVEGDWSGAAFLLVAGALAGDVTVGNLGGDQPDAAILEALRAAGARVHRDGPLVRVRRESLRAFAFDATDTPDLFPPLVALVCHCPGKSVIHGVRRLRQKESDRAAALTEEFGRLGADVTIREDRLEVRGGRLRGGRLCARGDHRIAMAGAVAALLSDEGVAIEGDACVAKSYPEFFRDLETLGAKT
jgi:3-phosphoshikimate 1-carboxyvinyltransferase